MKILKIKPWAVKFQIGEQKYLLKETSSDYETYCVLYKFDTDEFGRYTLEDIGGFNGSLPATLTLKGIGTTYKEMDTERFTETLCIKGLGEKLGLDTSIVDAYIKAEKVRHILTEIDMTILKLERLKKELKEL